MDTHDQPSAEIDTAASYSRVADEYASVYLAELDHKPIDRALLNSFAAEMAGRGPVCDLGCGPGHLARYLHQRGVDAFGIDISEGMVEAARRANPGIEFRQGDMRHLDLPDNSLAGIAAFYSIIHTPRAEVTSVLRELKRVLRPGGQLLLAFHKGSDVVHLDEWWDKPVSLDFAFFEPEEMEGYLAEAGLNVEEEIVRGPYPEVEHPSQRVMIRAYKPT